ncbi:hypothetical protein LUZ62_025158 [Rhynchospora pubera]|uniref:Knr4/Smi1-like domain-containing protein n=1 Tax=Rhynchospora pubera TaxID=906938 RepID=A0AAV8H9V4_9POAL|nr:hypothetical protein LUZ62_025158 [Rhynchospora pubera]
MVDVDRRATTSSLGLRRLSTRAASLNSPSSSSALHSFTSLASAILSHLVSSSVKINPGLSDRELHHLEASLGFTFPPDLRTLLSLGVPSGPGFPDWHCRESIRAAFDFPLAAASVQIAKSSLWPRSWGPRPSDPDRALRAARSAIRRAPLLIPLFDRCYVPCRPCLAGNPVFYVTEERVLCCGLDLLDFFKRDPAFVTAPEPMQRYQGITTPANMRRSLDMVAGRSPRWIEFWSDAASDRRRRDSSSSDSSTASTSSCSSSDLSEQSCQTEPRQAPVWVDSYLDQIGSVLKEAGWEESDVSEMVHVSASGTFDGEDVAVVDSESALDVLLVKAGRCSDSLRRAGWSSDEVTDALGSGLRRGKKEKRPTVRIPPEIAHKIEKLAHFVALS